MAEENVESRSGKAKVWSTLEGCADAVGCADIGCCLLELGCMFAALLVLIGVVAIPIIVLAVL